MKPKKIIFCFIVAMFSALSLTACSMDDAENFINTINNTDDISSAVVSTEEKIFQNSQNSIENTSTGNSSQQTVSKDNYYYNLLDENNKKSYKKIYEQIFDFPDKINAGNINSDNLEKVYESITLDHPEIFWLTGGYKATTTSILSYSNVSLEPEYRTKENLDMMYSELNSKVDEIISQANSYKTDYEKALFVHDYIVKKCDYDQDTADNSFDGMSLSYTAYGCLIQNKAVCAGYTNAYKLIMSKLGITTGIVTGKSLKDGVSHAWNFLNLDGNWYNVDVTWDDPVTVGDISGADGRVTHTYCFITDEELKIDHSTDSDNLSVPSCNVTEDNYFIKKGSYFTDYDINKIESILTEGKKDFGFAEMKFSTKEAYEQTINNLIKNGDIYNTSAIDGGSVKYSKDDAHLVLTIIF